jgi:RNA polymerase sigma-70 factor (ECF subfamily)
VLETRAPSPVIALNRAVAIAFSRGLAAGLAIMDALAEVLADYMPLHAGRADLLRRLGRIRDARAAYARAIALADNGPQRRFLEQRLASITD